MDTGVNKLIEKLNQFIKKYYLSRMFKGVLYTIAIWGIIFLTSSILEHFARLSTVGRSVLFFTALVLSIIIFTIYIFIPLLKYFRLGKTLDYKQAADIIGNHFEEVQDKLRNVLDLQDQLSSSDQSILLASIEQKIEQFNPIDFKRAIDLRDNLKYAKYILIPLSVFVLIWISGNVNIVTESSKRIVQYSEDFVEEAPFKFVVDNDSLTALSSHGFTFNMHLEGNNLPEDVQILLSDQWFNLQDLDNHTFKYDFINLQESITFKLRSGGFESENYTIEVFPFPEVKRFEITLQYPKYTGLEPIVIENQGDVSVPEGTKALWKINAKNGSFFHFNFQDSLIDLQPVEGEFVFEKTIWESENYSMYASNEKVNKGSQIEYGIEVDKDDYPEITITENTDEKNDKQLYFKGSINDDYGFSALRFVIETPDSTIVQHIDFKSTFKFQDFVHYFDVQSVQLKAGDQLTYYFEVCDNDGIHGAKCKRSQRIDIEIPTEEALKQEVEESNEAIKDELERKLKDAQDIQEELKKLQENLIQKKELSWEDKERIKELLEKQKNFEKSIDDLKEKNKEIIEDQKNYTENEELLEKQEKINELLEELMDEETREIFEEIEKMMDKLNKKDIQKKLEDLKMNNENLEKELDRNIEMLKQFQVEQKFQDNIDKLNELKEKQDELAEKVEETLNKDKEQQEKNKEEQAALNKEFEEFQNDMEDLKKLNESLESPFNIDDTKEKEEEVKQEMENSSQQMQDGKKKDAQKSQKKSSQKMEELSQMMQNMQQQMQDEANAEDMETLRQILENLVDLSFEEEALIEKLSTLKNNDPSYLDVMRNQNDIRFKSNLIADSLYALSKRQIAVEATVIKEVTALHKGLDRSIEQLAERKVQKAYKNGQEAMTSANNLALLLSQVLDQMQKQQAQGMPGSGSCSKPGGQGGSEGEEPSMKKMRSLQEQMKQQLKSMQQELLNEGKQNGGQQPGQAEGEKPGQSGKNGKSGQGGESGENGGKSGQGQNGQPGQGGDKSSSPMSEQIVKTAAKQEAIRRQLEEVAKSMEDGEGDNGSKALKKAIEKMKEIERDIVNKNITSETLKRQEEIMQKMLQAEKAEREQDKEKKRKAKEAKQFKRDQSEIWKKYIEEKKKQTEILYQKPIDFTPYYQKEVEKYFQKGN